MADLWYDVDVALSEVPVNISALVDDSDFKSREESVTYNQAGLDLVWNFTTTAGAMTQTAVTPTDTSGAHDWVSQGNGMYSIEIPASSGTINNDTEGFGWFTGFATGILPWRGPICGFRAAGINDVLIDTAYSATRGLTGTALPAAAADAAGGLPISDAGGLDMDRMGLGEILLTDNLASATAGALTLSASGSSTDGIYDGCFIVPVGGTGSGQGGRYASTSTTYDGTTKVLTLASAFVTTLGADTDILIYAQQADTVTLPTVVSGNVSADMIKSGGTAVTGSDLGSDLTAVKAKTDDLTFTVASQVDVNAKSVNEKTVVGDGTAGNRWRPQGT